MRSDVNSTGEKSRPLLAVAILLSSLMLSSAVVFLGLQFRRLGTNELVQAQANRAAAAQPSAAVGGERAFDADKIRKVVTGDFVYGNPAAPVTLISYQDFECPYCAKFFPSAKQVVDQSNGGVNLVLRLFPLDFHPHAHVLADAAECVGEQAGATGFYAFADWAFSQHGLGDENAVMGLVRAQATQMKLDADKVQQCMSSGRLAPVIRASTEEANNAGLAGTPTSVLVRKDSKDSKVIAGIRSADDLQSEVKAF